MRKSIALLLTLVLSATASDVRAQFGPPYHPLTGRPINRGVNNRGNIYGPRMPQGPGVPGPNDRYNPLRPVDPSSNLPPWMSPTIRELFNPTQRDFPFSEPGYDPLLGPGRYGPQGSTRGPGDLRIPNTGMPNVPLNPVIVPVRPPSLGPQQIDPKLFQIPASSLLEPAKPSVPAEQGLGEAPQWLRWEYAVGLFVLALLAGLARSLKRGNPSQT
jgi:hypothetical protein